ncbi:MAG: hypothetical protein ACE5HP_09770 [Gemmatimonadota bacterium]
MRRISLTLGLLTALVLPGTALAQEEAPPTLRLSFYRCDFSQLEAAMEEIESLQMPIWQELVDEGMIASYGHFIHSWASEWNVGVYTVAQDIPAVLAAVEEFGRRMEERNPDAANAFAEACPAHRDGFYTFGPRTGDDDGDEAEEEGEEG